MSAVLICWEDRYHDGLHRLLETEVRRSTRAGAHPQVSMADASSFGNLGFERFVREEWPMARQPGWNIAGAVTKIDHLVCVADADRAAECCRAAGSAPSAGQDSATWVRNAETEWTKQLRDAAPVAPDRVHGRFLRWSLESALLALFDEPAALGWMARPDGAALGGFLSRCGPDPRTLTPPSSFTDHFHDPQRCLRDLVAATNINSKVLSLSSAGRTFALEAAGGDDRARSRVLDRVPDLRAVASLIIGLG